MWSSSAPASRAMRWPSPVLVAGLAVHSTGPGKCSAIISAFHSKPPDARTTPLRAVKVIGVPPRGTSTPVTAPPATTSRVAAVSAQTSAPWSMQPRSIPMVSALPRVRRSRNCRQIRRGANLSAHFFGLA